MEALEKAAQAKAEAEAEAKAERGRMEQRRRTLASTSMGALPGLDDAETDGSDDGDLRASASVARRARAVVRR